MKLRAAGMTMFLAAGLASALAADRLPPSGPGSMQPLTQSAGAGSVPQPQPISPAAAALPLSKAAAVAASPTAAPASAAPVSPAAAAFPVVFPSTPESLAGEFIFVTRTGEAAKPIVRLSWDASESGTYVVRGYRLLRRVQGGEFQARMGADAPLADNSADDSVEIGKIYDYSVVAVDAKGNSSGQSAVFSSDLLHLDAALLAPRAPRGLTATSARLSVKLSWQAAEAWLSPISGYKVYRQGLAEALTFTSGLSYENISPPAKTDFVYRLASIDSLGRESAPSLSVTARATGTLAPSAPANLTATVKPEKVNLAWDKADPGTSPVTAYLIKRVIEPGPGESRESVKNLSPLDLSRTSYSDTVEGDHYYRYDLRAADLEGNSSVASSLRLWVPAKPFNKTAVLLMPTAYSNFPDRDTGFNVNVLFDLYIGELYESYNNPITQANKTGLFQPLQSSGQLGVVSLDLKDSILPETWLTPAAAFGFYGAALVPFGGLSSQQVAVTSSGGGFQTLGNLYAVVSKRFGTHAAIHLGGMYGNLSSELASVAPSDWEPTIRHLTPGGNYPDLFNRFLDPKLTGVTDQSTDPVVQNAPHLLFAGIQFPLTVPLGFTRWKTGLKLEVMAPVFPDLPSNADQDYRSRAIQELPLIWNIHIDNLPLFGFEFSIFQFKGGVEWLAFYHIPDLTWSF